MSMGGGEGGMGLAVNRSLLGWLCVIRGKDCRSTMGQTGASGSQTGQVASEPGGGEW